MHTTMKPVQKGDFRYYICDRLPVRHAFTTKTGGVSTGACESMNLGFSRGDNPENVRENYRILCDALGMDFNRVTRTEQVHRDEVSIVTEDTVGMGLHRPMAWESDAIVTNLPDTPLAGFYADCVVTINWKGTADKLIEQDPAVVQRFAMPIPQSVIDELSEKVDEFNRAYYVHGITEEEYEDYGPVVLFRSSFEKAWKNALEEIRKQRAAMN